MLFQSPTRRKPVCEETRWLFDGSFFPKIQKKTGGGVHVEHWNNYYLTKLGTRYNNFAFFSFFESEIVSKL